jgi:hypothetical protein
MSHLNVFSLPYKTGGRLTLASQSAAHPHSYQQGTFKIELRRSRTQSESCRTSLRAVKEGVEVRAVKKKTVPKND